MGFLAMGDLTHEPTLPLPHAAKDLLLFFRLLYNVRPSEPPSAADCITIMKLIHQYDCTSLALDSFFKEDFFDKEKLDSLIESKELPPLINAAADCKMDDLESRLLDYMAGRLEKGPENCCEYGQKNINNT